MPEYRLGYLKTVRGVAFFAVNSRNPPPSRILSGATFRDGDAWLGMVIKVDTSRNPVIVAASLLPSAQFDDSKEYVLRARQVRGEVIKTGLGVTGIEVAGTGTYAQRVPPRQRFRSAQWWEENSQTYEDWLAKQPKPEPGSALISNAPTNRRGRKRAPKRNWY